MIFFYCNVEIGNVCSFAGVVAMFAHLRLSSFVGRLSSFATGI